MTGRLLAGDQAVDLAAAAAAGGEPGGKAKAGQGGKTAVGGGALVGAAAPGDAPCSPSFDELARGPEGAALAVATLRKQFDALVAAHAEATAEAEAANKRVGS